MKETLPDTSLRRICRVLTINRSALFDAPTKVSETDEVYEASVGTSHDSDASLIARIRALAGEHPTFGYRRLWALLRHKENLTINRKRVHRLVKLLRLQVKQRIVTPRPRVQTSVSRAEKSNERWATDVTHVYCGNDGWGHLAAVIDCHDIVHILVNREIIGFEFAMRGGAKETERALEAGCLARFGTLRPEGKTPMLRSDNGLIFTSRRFRAACKFYRLTQEYITPYTPEQNGLMERFFRSLKEECVGSRERERGNITSTALRRQSAASVNGSSGTTNSDPIRHWATRAQPNIGNNNVYQWLD